MSALKRERRVLLLKVQSAVYPPTAPFHDLSDVLGMLFEIFNDGKAIVHLRPNGSLPPDDDAADEEPTGNEDSEGADPTNAVYISDMIVDAGKQIARLLIVRGDPAQTNAAYANVQKKTVRISEPRDGESPAVSAHVVISYGKGHTQDGASRTVLERMPNVSRSVIFSMLNYLLRRYAASDPKFEYQNPKDKKFHRYRPRLRVSTKPSSTLKKDLEAGHISHIELIDVKASFGGIDANPIVKRISKRVQVQVRPTTEKKAMGLFETLQALGKKEGYDEVQFHVRGLPGNTSASPRMALEIEDAAEFIYSRVELLEGFNSDLEQCYSKCNDDITKGMEGLLSKKKLWE